MVNRTVALTSVSLPDFGLPQSEPTVDKEEYETRIDVARSRAAAAGFDILAVYGDREHFANLAYLTGHDPRFEEALLVVDCAGGVPALILGNEGLGYSELSPVDLERKLYQGFSLPGQDRSASPRLDVVLRACGIGRGDRVGLVGWKYATGIETSDPNHWFDVPAFIVDALVEVVGDRTRVVNVTPMFINPVDGLRTDNSVAQLAAFEFAATHASQAVRNLIEGLEPGITELQAVQRMGLNGLPLAAHLMFSTGPRSRLGLPSPSQRTIRHGDPFFTALGLRGGLSARGGFVVAGASELPAGNAEYLSRVVEPYFSAVVAWYESLGLGVTGGQVQAAVDEAFAGGPIRPALNPGHLIHLDEWVHSPVYPGSGIALRSGMLIQCDIIPVVEADYHTTNAEDTVALADQPLRERLARDYPGVWARVEARRAFMGGALGIRLRPEVLPFSNLAGALQPFALSPHLAMAVVGG